MDRRGGGVAGSRDHDKERGWWFERARSDCLCDRAPSPYRRADRLLGLVVRRWDRGRGGWLVRAARAARSGLPGRRLELRYRGHNAGRSGRASWGAYLLCLDSLARIRARHAAISDPLRDAERRRSGATAALPAGGDGSVVLLGRHQFRPHQALLVRGTRRAFVRGGHRDFEFNLAAGSRFMAEVDQASARDDWPADPSRAGGLLLDSERTSAGYLLCARSGAVRSLHGETSGFPCPRWPHYRRWRCTEQRGSS